MAAITSYKGHSFLEITDAGKAATILQPCVDEMAWEGNDHPAWGEMLLHSYPVDGVMAGPPNISIDRTKCIGEIFMYNRKLTADEQMDLFAATKTKYGI